MKMKWAFRGAIALIPLSFLRATYPACSNEGDCPAVDECCGGRSRQCEERGVIASGDPCASFDGCDCASGEKCEGSSPVCQRKECLKDSDCESGCCGGRNKLCQAAGTKDLGDRCYTSPSSSCDCRDGTCDDVGIIFFETGECKIELCDNDRDCDSGCCGGRNGVCQAKGTKGAGEECFTFDGCDCMEGLTCASGICAAPTPGPTPSSSPAPSTLPTPSSPTPAPSTSPAPSTLPTPSPLCPDGTDTCDDPHMHGLRGQRIDWSGIDGGWYCLVKDEIEDLHVNVRVNAPLPIDFPHRQLVTAISIISEGHSLGVEVKDPYSTVTGGCPSGISPCLADGGVLITVDGQVIDSLLTNTRDEQVVGSIWVSASNLPVECRQFGADRIWARMYEEFLEGRRTLATETFEDWLLKYDSHAASGWCRKYIEERGLAHLQSNNAAFRIVTTGVSVRLNVGVNYQGGGEVDWDGRKLPDLEFWQMDIGFEGLEVEHESLTGLFGETARPVLDDEGLEIMEVHGALRGEVEDYRVSGALGTDFTLPGQEEPN